MTDQACAVLVHHHKRTVKPPPGGMQTGGPFVPCGAPIVEKRYQLTGDAPVVVRYECEKGHPA